MAKLAFLKVFLGFDLKILVETQIQLNCIWGFAFFLVLAGSSLAASQTCPGVGVQPSPFLPVSRQPAGPPSPGGVLKKLSVCGFFGPLLTPVTLCALLENVFKNNNKGLLADFGPNFVPKSAQNC